MTEGFSIPAPAATSQFSAPASTVLTPEVLPPSTASASTESLPPDLAMLRNVARLLDNAFQIPGTQKRIGIDALVGFIPWVGDALGVAFSLWIVYGALKHRLPFWKIVRILRNIVWDELIGLVPFLGDVADVFVRSNQWNVELVLAHRDRSRPPKRPAQVALTAFLIAAGLVALNVALFFFGIALLVWLFGRG